MKKNYFLFLLISYLILGCNNLHSQSFVLNVENFRHYIDVFNKDDNEIYGGYFSNNEAWKFLSMNIPIFNCPDKELEKTYYFRWWTFRKHIKQTPEGFVITEFLPDVPWAGKYNTISCPAGHHFYEGRWLHNSIYLQDYANFWFKGGGEPRRYSFWAANSILTFAEVHQKKELVVELLPFFDKNYKAWEKDKLCEDGLFWQMDDRDGMELSIGGSGKRTTINSYMFGEAEAIFLIANLAGNNALMEEYEVKAAMLKSLILSKLWDEQNDFFKTLPIDSEKLVNVRELHGYTPWYFSIPGKKHSSAWNYILQTDGFQAPFGPTSAEQDHPDFMISYEGHECQWNGPSWPFATSVTLKAMANLLRNYNQRVISKYDFMQLLLTYSMSHRRTMNNGSEICWIDENLNPYTGDWISRSRLKNWHDNGWSHEKGGVERGKDYNHSAFCDFIISDLVGIRSSMGKKLEINPLIPSNYWNWFCLDNVNYHGKIIAIIWDREGTKYQKGKGFFVFLNGEIKHHSDSIRKVEINLY